MFSTIGQIDAGECSQLAPVVTWPSDVDRFKARVNTYALAAQAAVQGCAGLSAADRLQWNAWMANWTAFAAVPTPTFGSYNQWMLTCEYSRELDQWFAKLNATQCAIPGTQPPVVQKPIDLGDLVKWGTVGAVALGGVYALSVFAPTLRGLFTRGKR